MFLHLYDDWLLQYNFSRIKSQKISKYESLCVSEVNKVEEVNIKSKNLWEIGGNARGHD